MFKVRTMNHSQVSMSVEAKPHEHSIFPVLVLKVDPIANTSDRRSEYVIQRANHGLPGYYVHWKEYSLGTHQLMDEAIDTAYLTDYEDRNDEGYLLTDLPRAALKRMVRSYVHLAIANLFSRHYWVFSENGYCTNQQFPQEMKDAVDKFVELEVRQIRGEDKPSAETTTTTPTTSDDAIRAEIEAMGQRAFNEFFGDVLKLAEQALQQG